MRLRFLERLVLELWESYFVYRYEGYGLAGVRSSMFCEVAWDY